jgi:hypothetical protein
MKVCRLTLKLNLKNLKKRSLINLTSKKRSVINKIFRKPFDDAKFYSLQQSKAQKVHMKEISTLIKFSLASRRRFI